MTQLTSVATWGAGPPVLLLHSSGMSSRQWRRLGEELAPTHRALAPDLLGSGAHPPWPADAPFELGQDVDALEELLLAQAEPAHVVGHSYGGLLAVTLARRHPTRIRSLAAYDPVAFGVLHDAADAAGLTDLARASGQPVFTDDRRGGGEEWLAAFVDYWNGAGAWRALPEASRAAFLRVGRKVYGEVSSLMRDRTPRSAYAGVTAPTLLLTGEHTPVTAQRVVALLAEALPRARQLSVAGAGHMGPLTHGAAVNAALAAHIRASS